MDKLCTKDDCNNKHLAKGLCSKHYHKQWAIDNPEKAKAKHNRFYKKHSDRCKKKSRAWRKENIGIVRKRSKANYHKNKDYYARKAKDYYAKNGDKLRAYSRGLYTKKKKTPFQRWKADNPELSYRITKKAAKANRTAEKYGLLGRITSEQIWNRVLVLGEKCWLCSAKYNCIDHVIPMGKGGENLPSNIRPCCNFCNRRKNIKIVHK